LYSNTGRAHELKMTRDWVVIYCDDGTRGLTSTVATAQRGRLKGRRVVRGREGESAAYYGVINPTDKGAEEGEAVQASS
jgi:putative hydrolase